MQFESKQDFLESVSRTHGKQLRRFLANRLRNSAADTADLMQEVYLRLLRIDDYETIRNPQAYLHTIASHVLQQHALRQQATAAEAIAEESEVNASSLFDPAIEVETDQTFGDIERDLKAQAPRAYMTLVLSRCYGMPLQDIADQLGVSRGQVKKYLAKALLFVRESLSRTDEGGL